MATPVVMPRQGNSVESCIIVEWKKQPGDEIAEGDVLCEIETDKAVMEVESPASGALLELFFGEGDLVPVLETIAAVGAPGEDASGLRPSGAASGARADDARSDGATVEAVPAETAASSPEIAAAEATLVAALLPTDGANAISPRARNLATSKAVDRTGVLGTGPGGRIIERDVEAAIAAQPRLSPVAKAMVASGDYQAPTQGSGVGGRVMSRDLSAATEATQAPTVAESAVERVIAAVPEVEEAPVTVVPIRGVRRVIVDRMRDSLLSTAQLTMNRSVDARSLLSFRRRLKASDDVLGLQGVTINDLVLFVTARTLALFPDVNALFFDKDAQGEIHQYGEVHLAFAVDTPRGLIVPVITSAQRLSLRQLAAESNRLAAACLDGTVKPDEITGGTFTVTNLGNLGVESFTPILNPPQVGILGVGGIVQKPLPQEDGGYVVDGAPGARFLGALAQGMTELDLLLAM